MLSRCRSQSVSGRHSAAPAPAPAVACAARSGISTCFTNARSCRGLLQAEAAQAAPGEDAAERIRAEPVMLEVAPAVDLAEQRPEAGLRRLQPVLQHARRAQPPVGGARETDAARAVIGPVAQPQRDAGVVEADLLGVEPDQGGAADPARSQQQQGAITQPGEIARTGGVSIRRGPRVLMM